MSENPSGLEPGKRGRGLSSVDWPELAADCDPNIAEAVNTLLGSIRVNDALLRISRTIGARRRRAKEQGSGHTWWPKLNQDLRREHIDPLREDLFHLAMRDRYASFIVENALNELQSFLKQEDAPGSAPGHKSDLRLVDEFLQPIFESLRALVTPAFIGESPADTDGGEAIIRELERMTLRQWFELDAGASLERLLQHLVLAECYSASCVEDGRSLFERFGPGHGASRIRWNESGIDALLVAVAFVRERFESRLHRRRSAENGGRTYFCELCDELTQWMSNERDASAAGSGSKRYCERHASTDRQLYQSDVLKRREFEWIYSMVLLEAKGDAGYKERFLQATGSRRLDLIEHTESCRFCSGRPFETECFDPSKDDFPSLMAFHANARKVAYSLAQSLHDGRAFLIDEAVQRGEDVRQCATGYRLDTGKALGQRCGLALAHLMLQGKRGSEIAEHLRISASAVSQRKTGLRGSFDFNPERQLELVWWPFDDIAGPDIVKFPSRPMGWDWRHSEDEYHHLVRPVRNSQATAQRRTVDSSSSRPTKSSARKCV
ncbi:hypothetical protein [Pseudomarimonas arenosa]|uniref:MarR family transcriptional regulator n=1 Tax=Pseudomarimonas arenosa TaxID=2774145 RepID=A0AAW3ZJE8_9GAMM|nr:hypothetical protein [Pseudomarimonas arenosa]MBD8526218.1 hypothetical protein [Pseudomarimonas arenosa]